MQSIDTTPEPAGGTVLVVDDDVLVRGSMDALFRSVGLATQCYASAQELLAASLPDSACCMVVDVRMPLIGGFECQQRLADRGDAIPIIFMTGHGDIPMSVKAMKSGAVDFLAKPFRDQEMLDAVSAALARDRHRRHAESAVQATRTRYARLTQREREVMEGVVRGRLNKQIAGDLELSEITVKLHRASLMKKMEVRTVPDLVRLAEALRLSA